MLLSEFRELTASLDGDHELLCAGAEIGVLWHNDHCVSVDDDASYPFDDADMVVLWRDE